MNLMLLFHDIGASQSLVTFQLLQKEHYFLWKLPTIYLQSYNNAPLLFKFNIYVKQIKGSEK